MSHKREESTTPEKKPKRVRKDTFTHKSQEEICELVNKIISDDHATYSLNKEYVEKKDASDTPQFCWRVEKSNGRGVKQLFSAATYRSFYVWYVYDQEKDTEDNLEKVDQKGDDKFHHGHRCGVEDCCNPDHIRIISRKENEIDKHYHYFLNSDKREEFIKEFSDELKDRGIW